MIELFLIPLNGRPDIAVQTIDDGWAAELRQRGYDPNDYNRLTTRAGATRWNSIRVLVQQADFEFFLPELPLSINDAGMTLSMDGVQFPGMWMLPPKSTVITHRTGGFLDVEIVDERYFWQNYQWDGDFQNRGFNVSTSDRTVLYTNTDRDDPDNPGTRVPLRYKDAIEMLTDRLTPWAFPEDFIEIDCDMETTGLCSSVGLRELMVDGMPVARLLDRVLMAAGRVLVRFNQTFNQAGDDRRYAFNPPHFGETSVMIALQQAAEVDLIHGSMSLGTTLLPIPGGSQDPPILGSGGFEGGGASSGQSGGAADTGDPATPPQLNGAMLSPTFGGALPSVRPSTAPDDGFVAPPGWWQRIINRLNVATLAYPQEVAVHFPTADADEDYKFDADSDTPGSAYVTRRWHVETSQVGIPPDVFLPASFRTVPLFDPTWARFLNGALQNSTELMDRAAEVSEIYYGRFRSGICDMVFRQVRFLDGYVGEQEVWVRTHGPPDQLGPFTRIRGQLNDPIFGWDPEGRDLTAFDVLSIGGVRAIPRPDGSVLLDAPPVVGGGDPDLFMGVITEWDGQDFNAVYVVNNLAGSLSTPNDNFPACTPFPPDPANRCLGIQAVTPYNQFFDNGQQFPPGVALVDFHHAFVGDFVLIGKVADEVPMGVAGCTVDPEPNEGCCCEPSAPPCNAGAIQSTQTLCDAVGWEFQGVGSCCPADVIPGDAAIPAVYTVWVVEDVKISTCPGGQADASPNEILIAHGVI